MSQKDSCTFFFIFIVELVLLSLQVSVMVVAAGLSCAAAVFISGYSILTLTYGEEDEEVFHHHHSPEVVTTTHTHTLTCLKPNRIAALSNGFHGTTTVFTASSKSQMQRVLSSPLSELACCDKYPCGQ